jgi:hypothetical protein
MPKDSLPSVSKAITVGIANGARIPREVDDIITYLLFVIDAYNELSDGKIPLETAEERALAFFQGLNEWSYDD